MIKFFRKIRQRLIAENKITNYLIYAIGEIILVVIGILLAVYINERIKENTNKITRCTYLEELKFAIEYDIKDVEESIIFFEDWNPKLQNILGAIKGKSLKKIDSINDKIEVVNRYIYFIQQSKSKIEELKYSNIDLIKNRDLKNKILLYQDSDINVLLDAEQKYNLMDEERRQYFSKNIIGKKNNIENLENDDQFFSIVYQKFIMNEGIKNIYKNLLKKQVVIKKMLESELENNCKEK